MRLYWIQFILFATAIPTLALAQPIPINVNLASPGTHFSPGVRGQAAPCINMYRPGATTGNAMAFDVARGSNVRGVAGGLEADIFNWETRNDDARFTTLDYLRNSRDYYDPLTITTNMRGLTAPDPNTPGGRIFTDTSAATMSTLAADWVRYTNVIAQTYHQGDTISNPADQAVLNKLVWSSANPGDVHDLLPAAGEAKLPKVQYFEIGNEPRVGLSGSYNVTNSYTFLTPNHTVDSTHKYDFNTRYGSMAAAMKAVDPTVKVGPCLQSASAATEKELLNSILNKQSNNQYLPIDFISYHPYEKLMDQTTPAGISTGLQSVYTNQKAFADNLRSMITASGRNAASIELIASEVNVSNWPVNETPQEAQMAHAIGSVETVFSFARLGLSAAHYWLWPSNPFDATKYPVYKAYEGLRDHMGDTLLSTYDTGPTRVYTTRNSTTGEVDVWGLNLTNDTDASVALSLSGLNLSGYSATRMTLQSTTGPTTFFSANLANGMPGGPTNDVDWVGSDLTGVNLSNDQLTLPAATVSVLVLKPVPEPGMVAMIGFICLSVTRRRWTVL